MGTYSTLFNQEATVPPQSPILSSPEDKVQQDIPTTSERKTERTENRTEKRSDQKLENLPIKRRTKRYSFEFYEDQLTKLKQLKRQAEDRGENVTLSDMARAAMDFYLKTK